MNIKGLTNYSEPLVASATVLGIAFIAMAGVGGYSFYKIRTADNTITVTGSAKEAVTADFALWNLSLEAKVGIGEQQLALNRLETAKDKIVAYLEKQGFSDVEAPVASVNPTYYYPEKSEPVMTGYTASRQIIVRSADIDTLSDLANNIQPLTGAFYNVSTGGLELTYQKLPEMRVKLLTAAIADAKARAESIAKETGRSVGTLRSASGGVVQVLSQGGIDVSDYGSYDTQSKKKEVMVTVRADFSIR
jgi:uncharacterized protein